MKRRDRRERRPPRAAAPRRSGRRGNVMHALAAGAVGHRRARWAPPPTGRGPDNQPQRGRGQF
eukprot:113335-Alexandrium_andersonii.AAC.1